MKQPRRESTAREYDAVLCISLPHRKIALTAIRSLQHFIRPRNIFIITSLENFSFFRSNLGAHLPIRLLDEDQIIENITLDKIRYMLLRRVESANRAGWYFQQFLKMAVSSLQGISDHYLIWDADTVLLQSIGFFDDDGTILISPKTEHHRPYFEWMEKALGIKKQVEFSFISEHLLVRTAYMQELLADLEGRAPGNSSWVEFILNSIETSELETSGFSEYETYGNYISVKHPGSYRCRPLQSTRNGMQYAGTNPKPCDLFRLMKDGHTFATFEPWRPVKKDLLRRNKWYSKKSYAAACLTGRFPEQRRDADALFHSEKCSKYSLTY